MMGSRGEAPLDVTTLVVVSEIVDLLKSSDDRLKRWVGEMRVQQEKNEAALAALSEAQDEHSKREARLGDQSAALTVRQRDLDVRQAEVAAVAAELKLRQGVVDTHEKSLQPREAAMNAGLRDLAEQRRAHAAEAEASATEMQARRAELAAELAKARKDQDAECARLRAAAMDDAAKIRSEAMADAARTLAEVAQKQAQLEGQDAERRQRAAAIRSALEDV